MFKDEKKIVSIVQFATAVFSFQSKMLIVSPLVSLVDSTQQAIENMGIRSLAWKDVSPEEFIRQNELQSAGCGNP